MKIEPILLDIHGAAQYCGLSAKGYRAAMRKGLLPRRVPGLNRYHRGAIDKYLYLMDQVVDTPNPTPGYPSIYDQWKAKQSEDKFSRNKYGP